MRVLRANMECRGGQRKGRCFGNRGKAVRRILKTARRSLYVMLSVGLLWGSGCTVSRNIVAISPPPDQPQLQELEKHLNYTDPDAGQPDYVRTER